MHLRRRHTLYLTFILYRLTCARWGCFYPKKIAIFRQTMSFVNLQINGQVKELWFTTFILPIFTGRIITESEVLNSLLLYGALAREKNDELVSEYLKGLVHLNLNYPGAHFEKDAFANFYRAFEHLVTGRMLKQRKLKNELRQILGSLSSMGLGSGVQSEFKELYEVRGSQAMHAQLPPNRVDRETSMKMKVFADVVFFHVFKPVWENPNNGAI